MFSRREPKEEVAVEAAEAAVAVVAEPKVVLTTNARVADSRL